MGCETQVVPSWSKVATRASGGTKLGLAASVVDLTRPMMAALARPSFHEGKGSPGAVCARAEIGRNRPDKSGSAASPPSTTRRFGPDEEDGTHPPKIKRSPK